MISHILKCCFNLVLYLCVVTLGPANVYADYESANPPKKVLYISSYHPAFPSFLQQVDGLKSVFNDENIILDIEFMDTKRFPERANWEYFQDHLSYKLNNIGTYEVVVVADDNALLFALDQQNSLLAGIPIVFLGVNNLPRALEQNSNPQVTGVVESVSMKETIELMIKLSPKAKKIIALVDATPSGQGDLESFHEAGKDFRSHEFSEISLASLSWNEFGNELEDLDNSSAVLLLSAYADKNNKTYNFEDSFELIKNHLKEPVFHLWHHGLGDGVFGGKIISHYEQGKTAGTVVLDILQGEAVNNIPVINSSPNRYVFDYNELKKYEISEALLPDESIILNKPYSFYDENRMIVWSVVTTIVVLLLLLMLAVINIFNRKKLERELKKNKAQLLRSQEIGHVGSWELDLITNRLTWSDEVFRIFGHEPQSFAATYEAFLDSVHPDDRTAVDEAYSDSLQDGASSYEIVHRVVRPDSAEIRWVHERCVHERADDGTLLRAIGMAQDITERKRAEKEHEKLQAQLTQAQKMEAVGKLAGGVAHDFNNLLQVILGYGEMVMQESGADSAVGASVNQMLEAADRARMLVSQLLAFSRRQVLDMRDVDLNEAIGDMLQMLRRTIGEHIDMNYHAGHRLGIVRADPGQLGQILMNLCVNARDAMPAGGTLTIETENVRVDETYRKSHPYVQPGRFVLLSVTDTGCGMDEETRGKVFEPFYTTKEVGEGTGLGLATVYGLVKQHEGFVHVYSEVGKGSIFKIYLPVVERSAQAVGNRVEGPVPCGTETILLAEDEEMVRRLTRAILEGAGYTVLPAVNGEEALAIFEQHREGVDLLLLDVVMPKLGGRAVYDLIREKHPGVRALFASGYSMNAVHTDFVLEDGLTLIQKPARREDLLRKVRETLDSTEKPGEGK